MHFKFFGFLVSMEIMMLFEAPTVHTGPTPKPKEVEVKTDLVAELLVVCDKEFSDLFQQDRQRIIDYWAMQLWDINMRFKSLKIVDISFRVNEIIIIKKSSDQPFIEEARAKNGSLYIHNEMLKFSEWIAKKRESLPKFDIAVLATGAEKMEQDYGRAYDYGTACQSDSSRSHSTILVHFKSPWGNSCAAFARSMVPLLGPRPDTEMETSSGCKDKGYLSNTATGVCGKNQFFFSKCSDSGISKYVHSDKAKCLRKIDDPSDDFIVRNSNATHPPSLEEQCRLITGNRNAEITMDDSRCIMTKCHIPDGGGLKFSEYLYPLENTPCGNNKFCFRGRCLPQGYRLFNMGAGKCLHAGNRFVSNDVPVMVDCIRRPTPLDQLMILESDPVDLILATPYSTPNASENTDKCLTIDVNQEYFQYEKCSTGNVTWHGWHFIKIDATKQEFLLFHLLSKKCAGVDGNGKVKAYKFCNVSDGYQSWKFHDTLTPPHKWSKNFQVINGSIALTEGGIPCYVNSEGESISPQDSQNSPRQMPTYSSANLLSHSTAQIVPEYHIDHLLVQIWAVASTLLLLGLITFYAIHRARKRSSKQMVNDASVVYTQESDVTENIKNLFSNVD